MTFCCFFFFPQFSKIDSLTFSRAEKKKKFSVPYFLLLLKESLVFEVVCIEAPEELSNGAFSDAADTTVISQLLVTGKEQREGQTL